MSDASKSSKPTFWQWTMIYTEICLGNISIKKPRKNILVSQSQTIHTVYQSRLQKLGN